MSYKIFFSGKYYAFLLGIGLFSAACVDGGAATGAVTDTEGDSRVAWSRDSLVAERDVLRPDIQALPPFSIWNKHDITDPFQPRWPVEKHYSWHFEASFGPVITEHSLMRQPIIEVN